MKAIVIGSGFGGLGAANRLASKGYDVEIFEKRDQLGGRAYQYHINGFKFDGGPTVITAPYMFDELLNLQASTAKSTSSCYPSTPFIASSTTRAGRLITATSSRTHSRRSSAGTQTTARATCASPSRQRRSSSVSTHTRTCPS